jgi:hypothetical protein
MFSSSGDTVCVVHARTNRAVKGFTKSTLVYLSKGPSNPSGDADFDNAGLDDVTYVSRTTGGIWTVK